ncbi:MAG: D-cysteine desulfhydrase family protein [Anaerolineales bacterium]|nr:D-cysteine desulfhydrase family protein [Anaerolineales bacterium]MCB0012830.1 D-cysteine desulfhydrase family protein [Anaerolineales bacterium]
MQPKYPPRINLANLPTPVEFLSRLTQHLGGPELYIKRDDLTGLAGGGNKTRKLEYLLADALAQGCDHVITVGGPQSNHCRQTAAAAARAGLGCSLVLRGNRPDHPTGNLLLDRILGAHLYFTNGQPLNQVVEQVAHERRSAGSKPYIIPIGGSNVVGATGYVEAMAELDRQLHEMQLNIDFIVTASSSGGTQAGMVLGATITNMRSRILGISIDQPADGLRAQVGALATATATHLGLGNLAFIDRIDVNDDYLGDGYGKLNEEEVEAIQLMGQKEGVLLDPVYTGRAMAGLIDLIRWGAFTRGQSILFWHTGGMPGLFAYNTRF